MMVNELCPYNKYFDEPTNRPNGPLNSESSKIQANDSPPNNLDGKPIEAH